MVFHHQQIIIIEVVMIVQIEEKNLVGKNQVVGIAADMHIHRMIQTKVVSFQIN